MSEVCNIDGNCANYTSNELGILYNQLRRELDTLIKETEATLLLHDGKLAELCQYLQTNLSNTIRCLLEDMDVSGELDTIITNTVIGSYKELDTKLEGCFSVKNFGAIGDGANDDTYAIESALNSGFKIVFPKGTYLISKEINIPDNAVIEGITEKETILKAYKYGNNMKAVLRLSRNEVGKESTNAISGVTIKNLTIDAEGCDYGIYANYLTNESRLENLTVINATRCNICILKTWFATYSNLTAKKGKNIGFAIGVRQDAEQEVGVNAIKFSNLRSHSNGQDGTHNQVNNIEKGCGFLIGGCNTCEFDMLQAERNVGIGVIFKNYYSNHFGSMYIEGNSQNQTNQYGLYQNEGSTNGQIIDKLVLGSRQTILAENRIFIRHLGRIDEMRTMYGVGKYHIDYMEYVVSNNQEDFSMVKYDFKELYQKRDVNVRYSGSMQDRFINGVSVGSPFIIVVPKSNLTSSTELKLQVNNNSFSLGKIFRDNEPIIRKLSKIDNKINSISITGVVDADLNCDVFVGYFEYGSNFECLPVNPF